MTTTVREWTGLEAKALRAALRMTIQEFADYLGVGMRTVARWEARGRDIQPQPQTQAILDTALTKAPSDVRARFTATISGSLISNMTGVEIAVDPVEENGKENDPTRFVGPVPQGRVLIPVVVDGRQILLPLAATAVAGRDPVFAINLASLLNDSSRLDSKPVKVERAYELYLRGQGLLVTNERKQIEAAANLLDSALDIDPQFARAQAARGYAHWRQYFSGWGSDLSTLDLALGEVDTALRLDPDSIGARTTLIRICWDMGWHERALDIGRALYEQNPDSLDAALAFARALNNGGMAEVALPLTLATLQVDPTNPTGLKLLIWNYLMVGDYSSALGAARPYLLTFPRDSNTRWAVALAYASIGDIRAAIHTARDAIVADPGDITIWNLLGYLHRLRGDDSAAHDAWSAGIEQADRGAGTTTFHNLRVQSWLANVEACAGHPDRARSRVARLTRAEPHNGYLKYRLAHVLAELGDARRGVRILREAVQDGFLSVQLLQCDELLGLSKLTGLAEYGVVRRTLERNVKQAKNKYAPKG